jgi:hypothetical protein
MQIIHDRISALTIGQPTRVDNLTVYPLIAERDRQPGYLTLDEALEAGMARVTEVSEGGHVPELRFDNESGKPILLVDGEELVGARQNRILNLSILVGAGRKLTIPVSCVEQGRWAWKSRNFASGKRKLFAKARAAKIRSVSNSMKFSSSRRSDQAEVWAAIADKSASLGVFSDSSAMADIYHQREDRLQAFEGGFKPLPGQVGAVVAIGSRVAGAEVFDSSTTFAKFLRKLIGSYALDAIEEGEDAGAAPSLEQVRAFLKTLEEAPAERFAALGEGEDLRLSAPKLQGAALAVGGEVVHLAAFEMEAVPAR